MTTTQKPETRRPSLYGSDATKPKARKPRVVVSASPRGVMIFNQDYATYSVTRRGLL